MKENKNKPQIRFKGFTDDWEQRKFSDCYRMNSGYAFKMDDYCDCGIVLINGESIQHGMINDYNLIHLPELFIQQYPDFVLKEGDIVVGLNRPITNGNLKIARIPSKYNNSLLYQRAGKIIYKEECDKEFSYVLLSKEILKHTLTEAVGSDQPFISTSKLDKWQMMAPSNIEEQKKIGNCFRNIDNLITLHQRKCEEYKKVNNIIINNVLNGTYKIKMDDGSICNSCKSITLKEIGTLKNGYAFKNNDYDKDGKFNIITISNVQGEKFINIDEKNNKILTIPNDIQEHQVLKDGDILISLTGNVGRVSMNKGSNNLLNQRVGLFVIDNLSIIDKNFLFYVLNSYKFESVMIERGQGAAQANISKDDIETFEFPLYDIKVQRKIAEILSHFNTLIENEKNTITSLKQLKTVLLDKMFC